jgi:hypothetical protein
LCVEWLVSCFPSHLKLNTSNFSSFIFFNIRLRLHCSRRMYFSHFRTLWDRFK